MDVEGAPPPSAAAPPASAPGGAVYHLSTELAQGVRDAHGGGVKALCVLPGDAVVSGGDDKMVTVWCRIAPGAIAPGANDFASVHIW